MLKNYLKIALRNLVRRKTFSLINTLGLAFGIAACLIIYMYVSYERSYDTFNKNADNIYRLENVRYYASGTDSSAGCVALLGPTLKEEIPEVMDFTRLRKIQGLVAVNNQYFNEKNILWADSSFLTIFSFPLISGDASKALAGRYSAVITRNSAQKFFGSSDAIGGTIRVGNTDFKVTGVAENVPPNSHIKFDILLSFDTQLTDGFCWGCNNNNTYIRVRPGTKRSALEAKLPLIISKLHDRQKDGFERAYFLQPLKDIHLYSHLRFELEENGSAQTIYFLSLTALAILLIAWINYVNLSTARSIERAKEVGLRKVVGAGPWSLVRQFLIESFVVNTIAVLSALLIMELTFPVWSEMIGLPAWFPFWKNFDLIIVLAVFVLVSPLVGGIYPAFVLSSYSPAFILKGSFQRSSKGIFLRRGLVIFQFTISIILIVVTTVFAQQLAFMRNKDLGLSIKQKLIVNAPSSMQNGQDWLSAYKTLTNELRNQSLIEDATFSSVIPGMENGDVSGGVRPGGQSIEKGKQAYFVYIAQNYLNFFHINLACGRNYFESELKPHEDGTRALIINESAVEAFGFASPEKALGASVDHDNNRVGTIIGVIRDYHQQSLEKEIEPTVFECATRGSYFVFDVNTTNISKTIEGIKSNFTKIFPANPFEYYFLDEFFDRQYRSNLKAAEVFGAFTFLSISIACLGLIGLSSLMTIQRTKEIGVRKVLGASLQSLLALLSKEFLRWLLIANILACPVAYYLTHRWLQNFAYHIDITIWPFLLAGMSAVVIATVTVSWQALRAATANPVEALRYE
jgi:putative ABC transport system permease protein